MSSSSHSLSHDSVEELRQIHRQQTGEELTDAEAWEMAADLLRLGHVLSGKSKVAPSKRQGISIASVKKRVADCLSFLRFINVHFGPAQLTDNLIVIEVTAEDTSTRRGPGGAGEEVEKRVGERLAETCWSIRNVRWDLGLVTFELSGTKPSLARTFREVVSATPY